MDTMQEALKTDLKPINAKQFPLLLSATVGEFGQFAKHPAYIPGYIRNDAGIHICANRGPFFEIHKWLGRPEMFPEIVSIDSMFGETIFEVELKDIVWEELHGSYAGVSAKVKENPYFGQLKPEQVCQRCLTPLYDNAYAVFPDFSSRKGIPYCPTCMHQRYNDSEMVDPRGKLLCHGKVLARFKPRLSLKEVLVMLPNQDPEYLEILQDTYSLHRYVEKENDKKGLQIMCGTKYVGISGSIHDYVNVCIRWGNLPIKRIFSCRCCPIC